MKFVQFLLVLAIPYYLAAEVNAKEPQIKKGEFVVVQNAVVCHDPDVLVRLIPSIEDFSDYINVLLKETFLAGKSQYAVSPPCIYAKRLRVQVEGQRLEIVLGGNGKPSIVKYLIRGTIQVGANRQITLYFVSELPSVPLEKERKRDPRRRYPAQVKKLG